MSVTNIKIKKTHKDIFKEYAKKHNTPMSKLLESLIVYIAHRDIHPSEFFLNENINAFDAEERIIRELKKNRDTYVSFQRTFEHQYNSDVEYSRSLQLYNSKRLINNLFDVEQYEKFMIILVSSLILIDLKFLLIKEKTDIDILELEGLPDAANVMAEKLLELKNITPDSITQAAKHIINKLQTNKDLRKDSQPK